MGCFYKFDALQRLVLLALLCTFPLAAVTPLPASAGGQLNANFYDVSFGVKIQKLIDRAWKYYNKSDSNSLLDVVLEIKSEVEAYTGKRISIDKEIDRIESDVRKNGRSFDKNFFRTFKKVINGKEKK